MINQVIKTNSQRVYLVLDKVLRSSSDYYLCLDLENLQITIVEPVRIIEIGSYKDGVFYNTSQKIVDNLIIDS